MMGSDHDPLILIQQATRTYFELDGETRVVCKQVCMALVSKGAIRTKGDSLSSRGS